MDWISDIAPLMADLAATRPVFHSEADFQHTLAWELQKRLPAATLFLERPQRTGSGSVHLDILVRHERGALAIELKYKTRQYA